MRNIINTIVEFFILNPRNISLVLFICLYVYLNNGIKPKYTYYGKEKINTKHNVKMHKKLFILQKKKHFYKIIFTSKT